MMPSPDTDRPSPWRGWLPLIVFGIVYTIAMCVVVAVRANVSPDEGTTDFRDFWLTGLHFRESGLITTERGVHNYLPFFAIFMAPWSHLPLKVAIVLFTLLSLGLFAVTVVLTETLLHGGLPPRPRAATLIAVALALPYVHSCAVLGQVGLLLLFLIVATWFLVERGWEWIAGLPLGLAVLIKLLPAVLLVFFLFKLRWRVAASAGLIVLVLGAGLPLLGLGYERTVAEHTGFWNRAAVGHSARAVINAEKPSKAKYSNNALPIVLRRLLSHVNADPSPRGTELYVNFADLPRSRIWQIYLVLLGILVAATALTTLRATRPWPPTQSEAATVVRSQYGLWCCLMLLATPLLWTHYLVLAYWPLALLSDRAADRRNSDRPNAITSIVFWSAAILLLAWPTARAAGAQLASLSLSWTALLIFSVRSRALPRT